MKEGVRLSRTYFVAPRRSGAPPTQLSHGLNASHLGNLILIFHRLPASPFNDGNLADPARQGNGTLIKVNPTRVYELMDTE